MIINKFILHVLDKNSDVPIINDMEDAISPETDAFYQKIIRRIMRDEDLRKARFEDYENNEIRVCCDHIIYDEKSFVMSSQGIARFLFDTMKINSELDSCDLAVVLYTDKETKGVAIIKLDYKKLYTHEIGYDDEENKVKVRMVTNEIGIQDSQRIIHAALVTPSGINDEWHMHVLDKAAEKKETDSSFVKDFLKAEKVKDEKYLTKMFKKSTDNWITNAYGNNAKAAEGVRSELSRVLKEENSVNINRFVNDAITEDDKRESFMELADEKDFDENFSIDKTWVEKKLKRRGIKTNTGFDIKALRADFEDNMKYSIRKNEDGTVDIVIKNVEFYEEK